jgi:hypothetical protein
LNERLNCFCYWKLMTDSIKHNGKDKIYTKGNCDIKLHFISVLFIKGIETSE